MAVEGELRGSFEAAYGARFELVRRLSGVAFEAIDRAHARAHVRVKLLGVANEAPIDALRFDGGWAVVAPFIAGATLSSVVRTMRAHEHARFYRDAMFFGFAPILCRTVERLHASGEAHGGMHGDNVIVCWQEDVFVPRLVDVGASRLAGRRDAWPVADVASVVRHVADIARGCFWQDEVSELVRSLPSLEAMRSAIDSLRLVLGSLEAQTPSTFTSDRLCEALRIASIGGWGDAQRRFLKRASRLLDRERIYETAASDHARRLYDPDSVRDVNALFGLDDAPPGFSFEALVRAPRYPAALHV